MKCQKCGTENNSDWATFCRNCQEPLRTELEQDGISSSQSEETTSVAPLTDNKPSKVAEDEEKIEIGVTDPMDYIMGSQGPEIAPLEASHRDTIKPEPIENELTLYRDEAMKLSISESGDNARILVETLKDGTSGTVATEDQLPLTDMITGPGDAENQDAQESTATDEPTASPSPDNHVPAQNEDKEQSSATQKMSVKDGSAADDSHRESIESRLTWGPEEAAFGQVKQSKGVIYLSRKNLRLTGGVKIAPGDEVTINDKVFEVKPKPRPKALIYAGIGVAAIVIFAALVIVGNGLGKDRGQLIGTVAGAEDGRALAGQTVTITELKRSTATNQAGFFVFDQVPSGIYTVEFRGSGNSLAKERITVLKNETSTVALKESRPETLTPPPLSMATNSSEAAKTETVSKTGQGTLRLTITPANASVYADGKPVGVGSNSYRLAPGDYTLSVRKSGYVEENRQITIEANKALSLKITLPEQTQSKVVQKSNSELAYERETASNYSDALRYYDKVLEKDPRDVTAILGKARCSRAEGLLDNAMTYYMQAAKIAADKGDFKSQISALTGVIEIRPNTFTAYYARGEVLYTLGQYERAVEDFSKVIEIDNRNLGAYYKLGNSYYNAKNYTDALKTFLAAQELNFADPRAMAYLAKTYLALGDRKNSKKAYERFKELASYSTRLEFKRDPEWQRVLTALGADD